MRLQGGGGLGALALFCKTNAKGPAAAPPGPADCAPLLAACWARSIMISTVRAVAVSGGAAEGPPEAAKALERVSGPAAERASGWPRSGAGKGTPARTALAEPGLGVAAARAPQDGDRDRKAVPVHRKSHGGQPLEAAIGSALIELVRWDPEGYGFAEPDVGFQRSGAGESGVGVRFEGWLGGGSENIDLPLYVHYFSDY